jgi:hypothetical protein
MQDHEWVRDVARFFKNVFLFDAIILTLVGASFLIVGGLTLRTYGDRLFWGGIGAIILGGISIFAATGATQMYGLPSVFTAGADSRNVQDRMDDLRKTIARRYGFAFRMCIVGSVCIGLSALIEVLTR